MAKTSCLAGIAGDQLAIVVAALTAVKPDTHLVVARIDVSELGALEPEVLICDIDDRADESFEVIRQLRFVLPRCVILVFTQSIDPMWALQSHLAGVNGVLSKQASLGESIAGLQLAVRTGCFTDSRLLTSLDEAS